MWNSLPASMHLRDRVREVQARHGVVGELGIDPEEVGALQRGNEAEHAARRGKEDVAARLVGLGFQREAVAVALRLAVGGQEVQAVAEPRQGVEQLAPGVHLAPLAPAPEHVGFGAQLVAEVHAVHGLLQRVGPHPRVGARKGAVLEGGVAEQVGGRHRHLQAGVVQRLLEVAHDAVALPGRGVDGHQIVVVQVDAVGAQPGQLAHEVRRAQRGAGRLAEGVASGAARRSTGRR